METWEETEEKEGGKHEVIVARGLRSPFYSRYRLSAGLPIAGKSLSGR
jgi:hypothetical protein